MCVGHSHGTGGDAELCPRMPPAPPRGCGQVGSGVGWTMNLWATLAPRAGSGLPRQNRRRMKGSNYSTKISVQERLSLSQWNPQSVGKTKLYSWWD